MSATANYDAVNDPDLAVADELIESADIGAEATPAAAIRIVKGNPTDADVAVLVAVLTAAQSSGVSNTDTRPKEIWGDPTFSHRTFSPFSPYSYQSSGRF